MPNGIIYRYGAQLHNSRAYQFTPKVLFWNRFEIFFYDQIHLIDESFSFEFYLFVVIWIWYQSKIWRIFSMMKIQKFRKRWNHQNRSVIFNDLDEQTILFENFFATANDSVTFKFWSENENQFLWISLLIHYTKILLINRLLLIIALL